MWERKVGVGCTVTRRASSPFVPLTVAGVFLFIQPTLSPAAACNVSLVTSTASTADHRDGTRCECRFNCSAREFGANMSGTALAASARLQSRWYRR